MRGPAHAAPGRWTLVYDADCGFCRWAAARVARRDRRGTLDMVGYDAALARGLLADMPRATLEDSWHLLAPDGRRWSAGDAVPVLAEVLWGAWGRALFRVPGLRAAARAGYRWVARHRGRLGRSLHA